MNAGASRGRNRPLLALLGGVLGLLVLGGAELALRRLGFGGAPSEVLFTRLGERVLQPEMFAPHPERFFTLRAGYRRSDEHLGPNAIGDWPFRGRPLEPAPDAPARVLCIGDSCVYGLPLPANQSLPEALDRLLAERRGPGAALVANLGVPGYTTVQIRALVEEALERWAPDEVVLYPAAWNDQAPAVGRNDVELREDARSRGPLARSALAGALRALRRRALGPPEPSEPADRSASRVPEGRVEGEVRAAIRACRGRGVGVTVVVPPHPESTRATNPRMFRDADAVRRAAAAEGVPAVDLQAVLGAPEHEDRFFADLVHPAPEGALRIAEAVAAALEARIAPAAPGAPQGPEVVAFDPPAVPALGDVELAVRVARLEDGAPPPAVLVGGTVLCDVRRAGRDLLIGRVPRLAPGEARVGVQDARGAAFAPETLTVVGPALERLEPDADGAPRIRVTSRPGDRARIVAARALLPEPRHSARGAQLLDASTLIPLQVVLDLGPDGAAEAVLPLAPGEEAFLQALVAPRGEPEEWSFALLSSALALR